MLLGDSLNNEKHLGTHRFQRAGFRSWFAGESLHAGSGAYPGAFLRRTNEYSSKPSRVPRR
jgi:hypothetical protein